MPSFRIPSISLAEVPSLISPALLLCIIGYLQSISVAQKYATNHIVSPSQEFIALGFSKVIGSFFQSLDTTGSLSRTAVNCDTGARTQLSGMFAAVIVTIVVQFLTFLLYYLPRSSLSAIVLVASFSIYNLPYYPKLYKASPREFVICLITLIVTVFTTTVYGIGSGILLSVLEFLFTLAKPHWAVLGEIIVSASPSPDGRGTSEESERIYRDITRYKNGLEFPNMLIFRFDANMVFLNSSYWRSVIIELLTEREPQCIKEVVVNTTPRKPLFKFSSRNSRTVRPDEHIPDESNSIEITDSPTVKYKGFLILDFSSIDLIDVTACNVLVETISFILKRFKYKVIFSNVKGVVRDSMWRIIGVDLVDELPIDDTHDHLHESVFFVSLKFAVNHAKMVLDNERGGRATASQIGREYFVDEIWQQ